MEHRVFRILVTLGVPGVALGVFYLLLKSFSFEFSQIPPIFSGVIVIVFLIIVGGITLFALFRWSPPLTKKKSYRIDQ